MPRIMRDKHADPHRRDDMAETASPYLHPKLAVQEIERQPAGQVTYIWEGMPKPATAAPDSPSQQFVTDDSDDQTIQ
jgi:hypothetical protein